MASFRGVDLSLPAFNAPAGYRGDMIYRDPHARTLMEMMMQKMESDQRYADAENQRSAERWNMAANMPTQLYGTYAGVKERERLEDIAERKMRVDELKAQQESAYRRRMLLQGDLTNQADLQKGNVEAFDEWHENRMGDPQTRAEVADRRLRTVGDFMRGDTEFPLIARYQGESMDPRLFEGMTQRPDPTTEGPYVEEEVFDMSVAGPSQQITGMTPEGMPIYGQQERSLDPSPIIPTEQTINDRKVYVPHPDISQNMARIESALAADDISEEQRETLTAQLNQLQGMAGDPQHLVGVTERFEVTQYPGEAPVEKSLGYAKDDRGQLQFHDKPDQPATELFIDKNKNLYWQQRGAPIPEGAMKASDVESMKRVIRGLPEPWTRRFPMGLESVKKEVRDAADQLLGEYNAPASTALGIVGNNKTLELLQSSQQWKELTKDDREAITQQLDGGDWSEESLGGVFSKIVRFFDEWSPESGIANEGVEAGRSLARAAVRVLEGFRSEGNRFSNNERDFLREKLPELAVGLFRSPHTLKRDILTLRKQMHNMLTTRMLSITGIKESEKNADDINDEMSDIYEIMGIFNEFLVAAGAPLMYELENEADIIAAGPGEE